jgi:hypothetical protein
MNLPNDLPNELLDAVMEELVRSKMEQAMLTVAKVAATSIALCPDDKREEYQKETIRLMAASIEDCINAKVEGLLAAKRASELGLSHDELRAIQSEAETKAVNRILDERKAKANPAG